MVLKEGRFATYTANYNAHHLYSFANLSVVEITQRNKALDYKMPSLVIHPQISYNFQNNVYCTSFPTKYHTCVEMVQ